MRALALPTALLLLAGCLHAPPAPPAPAPQVLHGETIEVRAGDQTDRLLASMNDEELFTKGTAAYAASDFGLAVKAFDRLCDSFPQSSHFAAASYNAGLAHEQLAGSQKDDAAAVQWEAALARYRPLLDLEKGTGDQIDAGFRAAECLYHLGKYADAIALLRRIQARPDLSQNVQLEAEVQVGICQTEGGELSAGEVTLRDAVMRFEHADAAERLDDFYPAQAQFFLGEIYRSYFEQVVLDPNKPANAEAPDHQSKKVLSTPQPAADSTARLAEDLEYKAEMLLSAQGHYLRAMRIGNAQWATAAGQRVGQLYESMFDAMIQAPAPTGLDAEQVEIYRSELRKKVRVLVTKAISIYERTLEAAERTGTDSPFIVQARQSLDRMKSVLLAFAKDAGDAVPPPPPPHPQGALEVEPTRSVARK
jgi:tetratricopeptide (TPR) repeat protein